MRFDLVCTELPAALLAGALLLGPPVAALDGVEGAILASDTLESLPDAIVTVQTTPLRAVCDEDGKFHLQAAGNGLVVVAAAPGYFNASIVVDSPASGLTILLDPVPQDDDPDYAFLPPETCGACHPDQLAEWTESAMARAGRNRWVLDLYDGTGTPAGAGGFVYTRDSVHAGSDPESDCASCHQPEVWIASPFSALDGAIATPAPEVAHGVSCDVCHKIADVPESGVNFPGIYPGVVTYTRPAGPLHEQVQYGLLGDVDYANSLMAASYQPQLAAQVCGACHQDKNDPDMDGEFEEPNGVVSEPTYLEWALSDYADPGSPHFATCVDCHMPPTQNTRLCAVIALDRPAGSLRSHAVEGTTAAYLESAVELSVDAQRVGDALEVEVAVENAHTGHHVPTGVTVRNMVLLVEAWREEDGRALDHTGDQVVHDLGGVGDPARGYFGGLPGKLFAKVNHDALGSGPTFFTEATGIEFDNRIPALTTDVSTYTFDVPPGGGTARVRARLIYRRAFRFLVDAKGWTEDGHGNPLEDVAPPHFGHLMESGEAIVDLCPGGPPPAVGDSLRLHRDGAGTSLVWDDAGLAGTFHVYRGTRDDGASFAYTHACLDRPGVPESLDESVPAAGQLQYYLVSRIACGESGLGSGAQGPRPNDIPCTVE